MLQVFLDGHRWVSNWDKGNYVYSAMKKILLLGFTILSIQCFGQEWTDYKIDDNLTVQIPENFEVIDTLGQTIIKALIDNALIMVQRIPNKGEGATNIQNKEELLENYTGFQEGFVESQDGELISQQSVEQDGLQLTKFEFYANMGEERHIRRCLTVFLNDYWYTIQFWEVEAMSDELTKEREMLFSSLRFKAGLSLDNQMSDSVEGSRAYRFGYIFGKAIGYIFIVAIILAVIIWISKMSRRKSTEAKQEP